LKSRKLKYAFRIRDAARALEGWIHEVIDSKKSFSSFGLFMAVWKNSNSSRHKEALQLFDACQASWKNHLQDIHDVTKNFEDSGDTIAHGQKIDSKRSFRALADDLTKSVKPNSNGEIEIVAFLRKKAGLV
jgi:hypothetical protein